MSDCPTCPICQTSCDISEEDLIDADCGACGSVTIHVHCKEKYCRQQGIPKGQYKGYTCPQCTRAKVSAQHHRQRDKRKKAASSQDKSGGGQQSVAAVTDDTPKKQPIYDVEGLVTAVLEDCQSDPTTLQPLRQSFKRLLQIQRVFKSEEEQLINVWKPFSKRHICKQYETLRGHQQPAYVQATSLLKLTSQASVDGEGEDVQRKRQEVAEHLFKLLPSAVLEGLDANQEYGRCQPLYDDVVGGLDSLSRQCEAARMYLERLRKSLPAQVVELDEATQERMWPWCDVEDFAVPNGVVLCLANASNTSDEHQLRSPPFYIGGVPWTVRFYKTRVQGSDQAFLAAYLDASHALRESQSFEKQVTFTFTIRRLANPRSDPVFRKEATFVFKKDSDNRGWRECAPASAAEEGRIWLTVEVREGAVATENLAIKVKLEGCADVRFKVKHNTGLQKLMESYCARQHLRPEYVTFAWSDGKSNKPKTVEGDSTPSDLGMAADVETLVAHVKDPEVEIIMKRANVGVLEAAEAMEKCSYQPRKALQILASMQQAKAKAEATRKAEEEGARARGLEALKPKTFAETPLVISSNFAPADKPKPTPKSGERKELVLQQHDDRDDAWDSPRPSQSAAQDGRGATGNAWGGKGESLSQGSGGLSQDDPGLSQGSESAAPAAPAPAPAAGKGKGGKGEKGEDAEGFEEVKGKKKAGKKSIQESSGATMSEQVEPQASQSGSAGAKQPFGGRKVFIGGTADKDQEELREHFAQFGEVASIEVLKERDGAYRGFAFVTFYDVKSAQDLLDTHHTYIGNVRMEAKPCVQPRGELELDRKIEAILGTSSGHDPKAAFQQGSAFSASMTRIADVPAPTTSAWGSGPPAMKREVSGPATFAREVSGPPPGLGRDASWRREDVDLTEWKQAETDSMFPAIGNLGDMFDPEQPAMASASVSQASAADTAAGAGSGWDTACSSMDTPVPLGLESMLDFDDDENICSICFENLANACLKPCEHSFCTVCVKQLKKQAVFLPIEGVRCPSCRATVKDFILPSTGAALPTTSDSKTAWGSSSAAAPAPPPIQTAVATPAVAAATPTAAAAASGPSALGGTPIGQSSSLWGGGGGGGGGDIWGGGMGQVGGSFSMPGGVGGEGGSLWGGFGGSDPLFSRGAVGGNTWGAFGGMGDGADAGGGLWSGGAGGGLGGMFSMPTGSMEDEGGGGGLGVGGGLGSLGGSLGGSLWGAPADEKVLAGAPQSAEPHGQPAARDPDALEIKVKFTDDREVLVVARGGDTGRQLRLKIKELTGTPMSAQRLFFQGKVLEHTDLLRDKKVVSGVVVNCFPREAQPGEEEELLKDDPACAPASASAPALVSHPPQAAPPPAPSDTGSRVGNGAGMGVSVFMEEQRVVGAGGGAGAARQRPGAGAEGRRQSPERRGSPDRKAAGSEDERTEDELSEPGLSQDQALSQSSRGLSLSQEDEEWEAVSTKKKKGRSKGGGEGGKAPAGATQSVGVAGAAGTAQAGADAGKAGYSKPRSQFFGLWVGNVHSEVVDQEEFKAAFEHFGELCNAKSHGVPPINILPPSSSAFVNFCRYEDADAARTALQGKTVGSTGPLRINASDLMQKYEEEVVIPARKRAESARAAWGADEVSGVVADAAGSAWGGGAVGGPQQLNSMQQQLQQQQQQLQLQQQREQQQREQQQRLALQREQQAAAAQREQQAQRERELLLLQQQQQLQLQQQQQQQMMMLSAAERARLEQEKRDHELAIKMQRQEQYEAANAALIAQAERRKNQASVLSPAAGGPRDVAPGPAWGAMAAAAAAAAGGGAAGGSVYPLQYQQGPGAVAVAVAAEDSPRISAPRTLMDHLPSQLRGGEASQAAQQRQPNAWGMPKQPGPADMDGVLPLPPAAAAAAAWSAPDAGAAAGRGGSVWGGGLNGAGRGGAAWGGMQAGGDDAAWSANGEDEWEQAPARGRKGRGRGRGQDRNGEDVPMMFDALN